LGSGFAAFAPEFHGSGVFPWHDYVFTMQISLRMRSAA
jgi:hypothetical protein